MYTITQFHRKNFKPTYLYIKKHTETGKMYFGKTTRTNVEKYLGSGIHWTRHIKAHGKDKVVTLWYFLFTDIESLVDAATFMSDVLNIVDSSDWLNIKPESGLDGGSFKGFNGWAGKKHSPEHIKKLKKLGAERLATEKMKANMSRIGKLPRTQAQIEASRIKAKKMGDSNKGRVASKETKDAMSKSRIGKGRGVIYTIQTPTGDVTTDCLAKWCLENNINYSSLRSTIITKIPHKKTGFMIISYTNKGG